MASYYVDATLGDDSNPGTQAQPWKTISKVNSTSFSPGDNIYFKRGETWREQLNVPSSGSDGNPITFGAYGSGDRPIIHGGTTIPSDEWSGPDANGVYSYSYSGDIWFVTEDNSLILHASDSTCSDGNWYWDNANDTLYYKPTSGTPSDHVVDRVTRAACIKMNNRQYIELENLNLIISYSGIEGSAPNSSINNITISYCDISKCRNGIWFEGRNGNDNSYITISHCNISNCGESIFLGAYASATEKHSHCTISNNTIQNTGITTGSELWDEFLSGDLEAIGLQNINNSTISRNIITGGAVDGGIVVWTAETSTSNDNEIKRNYLKDLDGAGVIPGGAYTNNTTNNTVAYNIIVDCGQGSSPPYGGLRLNRSQSPSNKIYNNVLVGNDINLYLYSLTDYYIIKNNISYNPVNYHVRRDGEIGNNILDYNCYYPDTGTKFQLDGSDYDFSGWKTQTGQDAHSISQDPLFVDADYNDFHLQPASPCIDAGVNVGLTEDYEGNSVPWGEGVDIGAYERTAGRMKDYLDFSVPDYNYYLPVEPQEAMVERGEPWQEILLGSGFDEKRINLGDVKFYVTLKWPTLTESESNDLFSFYLAVMKSKTFRWQNPKDGYDYVVRFDTGMKRPISAGGLYSIEPVRLKVLKAIVTKGFGHGKFGQGRFGQG